MSVEHNILYIPYMLETIRRLVICLCYSPSIDQASSLRINFCQLLMFVSNYFSPEDLNPQENHYNNLKSHIL
jgi:hypothetical protein